MAARGTEPETPTVVGGGSARAVPNRLSYAPVVLACAGFLVLALVKIRLPGLYYDEVLFVNAALGGVDESFLHGRLFGVPIAVMSYIGALKSWLHAPVFWALGVSVETIRVPSILVSLATLLIAWRLGVELFGRALGAALVVLMATDPAFVLQARMDWGPTALMMLFKTAGLYCLVRWLSAPNCLWLWGLVASLTLGLFDKLNFVWLVFALGGAVLLVWPRETWRALTSGSRWRFLPLGVFVSVLAMAGAHSLRLMLRADPYVDVPEGVPLIERVPSMLALWADTATGSAYHRFVFAGPIPAPSWVVLVPIIGLSAFVVARRSRSARDPAGGSALPRVDQFFLVLLALLFVQMVATPQARGGHHALMAWPFHHLFAVAAIGSLLASVTQPLRRAIAGVAVTAGMVLVVTQVTAVSSFLRTLNDCGAYRAVWSPAIYPLADRMDGEVDEAVLSADWGLHNQLFAMASPVRRPEYDDLWQAFDDLEHGRVDADTVYQRWFRGRDATVVLFAPDAAARMSAEPAFLRFAEGYLESIGEPEVVRDESGRVLYELRRVRG